MEKCLVFDIFGDFAHFKRIYTTTSAYSYLVPPKTTLIGIIGAILGYSKDEYYKLFDKIEIGLRILFDPKTIIIKQNYLKTDGSYDFKTGKIKERTQIPVEFIKNPKYRIYLKINDNEIYNTLKEFLSKKKSYYTIYLGISECISNYKYIGEFEIECLKNNYSDTIVPEEFFSKAKLENIICIESLPILIDKNRITKQIKKFLIAKKVNFFNPIDMFKVGEDYVLFF